MTQQVNEDERQCYLDDVIRLLTFLIFSESWYREKIGCCLLLILFASMHLQLILPELQIHVTIHSHSVSESLSHCVCNL